MLTCREGQTHLRRPGRSYGGPKNTVADFERGYEKLSDEGGGKLASWRMESSVMRSLRFDTQEEMERHVSSMSRTFEDDPEEEDLGHGSESEREDEQTERGGISSDDLGDSELRRLEGDGEYTIIGKEEDRQWNDL